MKDFFNKKQSAQSKQTKPNTAKPDNSSKKFLNRFSKKRQQTHQTVETVAIDDNNLLNNEPTSIKSKVSTHDSVASDQRIPPIAGVPIQESSNSFDRQLSDRYDIPSWYALKGRIGRVQLLAYSMIWGIVISILFVAAMITGLDLVAINNTQVDSVPIVSLILLLLMIPAWLYSVVILPRRRLHDSGKTGWWLLLYIVPIASLYLLYLLYFKRGDDGVNKYGLPPAPYSNIELILAILLPILTIVSMGLFSVASSQILAMQMMQQDMTQAEVIDVDTINTETQSTDIAQDQAANTDASLEEIDPESAAQVQGAIDNAVNSDSSQVSYDDFLRESKSKILVDNSETPADTADSEVFVDEQPDDVNQNQTNTQNSDTNAANNE